MVSSQSKNPFHAGADTKFRATNAGSKILIQNSKADSLRQKANLGPYQGLTRSPVRLEVLGAETAGAGILLSSRYSRPGECYSITASCLHPLTDYAMRRSRHMVAHDQPAAALVSSSRTDLTRCLPHALPGSIHSVDQGHPVMKILVYYGFRRDSELFMKAARRQWCLIR